jgi:polyferredoxin
LGGTVLKIENPKKVYLFCGFFFMQKSLDELQLEITSIQARNARVEKEKAWETSWQRKLGIIVTTYFVMILVFSSLGNPEPFLNAIVPNKFRMTDTDSPIGE